MGQIEHSKEVKDWGSNLPLYYIYTQKMRIIFLQAEKCGNIA